MPDDGDLTPLAEGATTAHELFKSYVAAGFNDEQALRILIALLVKMTPVAEPPEADS